MRCKAKVGGNYRTPAGWVRFEAGEVDFPDDVAQTYIGMGVAEEIPGPPAPVEAEHEDDEEKTARGAGRKRGGRRSSSESQEE